MSADPIYRDMDRELRQKNAEDQKRAPRAYALRAELTVLYRSLDILDRRGAMVLLAISVLNLVIGRGEEDITSREEREVRLACDLAMVKA